MILFDKLGLAAKSEANPLKVLNSKFDYFGQNECISFIGISHCSLDSPIINKSFVLSVPDVEDRVDNLIEACKSIVKNISEDLIKNQK